MSGRIATVLTWLGIAVGATAARTQAAEVEWSEAVSQRSNDSGNWQGATAPGTEDYATVTTV